MADARPRLLPALVVAPLAGPVAVFVAALVRAALVSPADVSIAAVPVWLFIFLLFGAPPAYVATVVVLWPVARGLIEAGWFHWLAITAIAAAAGGVAMPLYLHLLSPRGTFGFFPGAGFVAGAAVGFAFWWMASRPGAAPEHTLRTE